MGRRRWPGAAAPGKRLHAVGGFADLIADLFQDAARNLADYAAIIDDKTGLHRTDTPPAPFVRPPWLREGGENGVRGLKFGQEVLGSWTVTITVSSLISEATTPPASETRACK